MPGFFYVCFLKILSKVLVYTSQIYSKMQNITIVWSLEGLHRLSHPQFTSHAVSVFLGPILETFSTATLTWDFSLQIRGKIMACIACAGGRRDLSIWHGLGGPRQIEEMSNQHQLPAPSFYNAMSSGGKLTKYRLFVGKILALPNHLKVWVQPWEDKRDFVKKQQCVLRQQWKTFFMTQWKTCKQLESHLEDPVCRCLYHWSLPAEKIYISQ